MCSMNHFGPEALVDTAFVGHFLARTYVSVKDNGSFNAIYFLYCGDFFNGKPLFQVSLSSIQVSLFVWWQTQLFTNLAA